MPFPDFGQSVRSLDNKRLGKQRVEVLQILNILHEINPDNPGWRNHPATLMWTGFEIALCSYGLEACEEFGRRGYLNTKTLPQLEQHMEWATSGSCELELPGWMGDQRVHLAHQSTLIRKDPAHYRPQFPGTPDDIEMFYPVARGSRR